MRIESGRHFDHGPTKSNSLQGRMAKQYLLQLAHTAAALAESLDDNDDLPQWVHYFIAVSQDRLGQAAGYMQYQIQRENQRSKAAPLALANPREAAPEKRKFTFYNTNGNRRVPMSAIAVPIERTRSGELTVQTQKQLIALVLSVGQPGRTQADISCIPAELPAKRITSEETLRIAQELMRRKLDSYPKTPELRVACKLLNEMTSFVDFERPWFSQVLPMIEGDWVNVIATIDRDYEIVAPSRQNPGPREFSLSDLTSDEKQLLVDVFQASYLKETGAAWSTPTFLSRARGWIFYGEVSPTRTGVVAIRHQNSGMNKLVAVAGDPRAVLSAIRLLMATRNNEPVWGAVSADLVPLCERYGLIAVHQKFGGPTILRAVAKMIPAEVFGGNTVEVQSNGALRVRVVEIGEVEKYFVANKAYFAGLAKAPADVLPATTARLLKTFVASLV